MALVAVDAGHFGRASALRERSLIHRAREMDAGAWDVLYESHHPSIYRYCYFRLGNPATAEDLAADVFLEAVKGIGRYEYRGISFRAWLYRIAHNLVADHHARARTRDLAEAAIREAPPVEADFAGSVLDRQAVLAAVAQLTDDQQQVIALRFFEGLPLAETAEAMGRPVGAVKQLQHRAIGRLRAILGANGGAAR